MTCIRQLYTFSAIGIALCFLVILIPGTAFSGQVTLAWTKNIEPDIAGYKIFCREQNGAYNYNRPSWDGSGTECVIEGLDEGKVYYSIVRAYNNAGIESVNSNEVSFQVSASGSNSSDPNPSGHSSSGSSSSGSISPGTSSDGQNLPGQGSSDAATELILDNGEPGTSWDGSWKISGGPGSYGNTSVYSNDTGATYTFEKALTGYYDVALRWTYYSTRCTNVNIDIYDGDYLLVTAEVNQQSGENLWNSLGEFEFSDTARVVIHSGNAYCSTNVDGIRFLPVPDSAAELIIDNGDPGTSWDGSWKISGGPGSYGNTSLYSNEIGAAYTFETVSTGYYEVSLRWTYYQTRCTDVAVDIYDGDYLLLSAEVDQQSGENQWNTLGEFEFSDTARVVIHSGNAYCSTNVDGVRFAPIVGTTLFSLEDSDVQPSSSQPVAPELSDASDKSTEEGEAGLPYVEGDPSAYTNDSGGCFISIYTEFISTTSEKTFLFYNVIILILAILSLYLMYSLNNKN